MSAPYGPSSRHSLLLAPRRIRFDGSGTVDFGDILAILAAWGNEGGPEDLDGSGFVDIADLIDLLTAWGPCE